jgi:hypothetical protein
MFLRWGIADEGSRNATDSELTTTFQDDTQTPFPAIYSAPSASHSFDSLGWEFLVEIGETAKATLAQPVRLFQYGVALRRRRSLSMAFADAQMALGQCMYAAGIDDGHVGAQIARLNEEIHQAGGVPTRGTRSRAEESVPVAGGLCPGGRRSASRRRCPLRSRQIIPVDARQPKHSPQRHRCLPHSERRDWLEACCHRLWDNRLLLLSRHSQGVRIASSRVRRVLAWKILIALVPMQAAQSENRFGIGSGRSFMRAWQVLPSGEHVPSGEDCAQSRSTPKGATAIDPVASRARQWPIHLACRVFWDKCSENHRG